MKVQKKIQRHWRKFYILPILASKMIILTVYTLYLDDNVLEIRSVQQLCWSNYVINGLQMKAQKKLRALRNFFCFANFDYKKVIILTIYTLRIDAPKFLYFANFDFKNDYFDSLYTVSRWQFFQIMSVKDYFFGP